MYDHIELKQGGDCQGKPKWTWRCTHCGEEKSWSSVGRVVSHLACVGSKVTPCVAIPDEIKEKFVKIVERKERAKKEAEATKQRVEEAKAAAAAEKAERTQEKLRRGIIMVRAASPAAARSPSRIITWLWPRSVSREVPGSEGGACHACARAREHACGRTQARTHSARCPSTRSWHGGKGHGEHRAASFACG